MSKWWLEEFPWDPSLLPHTETVKVQEKGHLHLQKGKWETNFSYVPGHTDKFQIYRWEGKCKKKHIFSCREPGNIAKVCFPSGFLQVPLPVPVKPLDGSAVAAGTASGIYWCTPPPFLELSWSPNQPQPIRSIKTGQACLRHVVKPRPIPGLRDSLGEALI